MKFQDTAYKKRYTQNTKNIVLFFFKVISLNHNTLLMSVYELYDIVTEGIQRNVFIVQVIFFSLSLMF